MIPMSRAQKAAHFRLLEQLPKRICGRNISLPETPTRKSARSVMTRHCEQCAKEMKVWPSELTRGRGRFCSKSCATKARERVNKIALVCEVCKVGFERWPSALKRGGRGRFCSKVCAALGRGRS
jgi:hypothetical protein